MPSPSPRNSYELPQWANWLAVFLVGSAFAALAFHPALRHERDLQIFLLLGGGISAVAVAFIACRWLIDIRRGRISKWSIFQSNEQIMRNCNQQLAEIDKLLQCDQPQNRSEKDQEGTE